ncbi:TetR/AcrR family transcriptional regulator [Actinomadura rupiterrae]|uniref:TetR/AcrR family transcriptional regulator n=1 Tax=Actinomadura rupiterrae TaxID=559627 RepID=UPI0020A3E69A|nr:TetR/AcrR family transcriptional regulator [Actinomadura rupiterrae]MCP2341767.1 AcrR family transcriptional regulator [Actinomadura rupiterrae]
MSPRSAETNRELREQSRRRILDAALELFAERGYGGASVAQIADRAGVARGLVSYYFPAKERLLEELLTEAMFGIFGLVAPAPEETTADERLAGLIDRVLLTASRTVPLQRLVLCLMLQPATRGVYVRVEASHAAELTAFEDAIRSIFTERGAPDPALEEVLLRSVLEGVVFKLAVYPDTYPLEAVRRRVYAIYDLSPAGPLLPDEPDRPADRLRS